MTNRFYVYSYKNPKTNEIIYIGKGTRNRYKDHLKPSKLQQNKLFYNKLRKILAEGNSPIIEFIAVNLTETEALTIEAQKIKEFKKYIEKEKGQLLNITNGGQNCGGYTIKEPLTEEKIIAWIKIYLEKNKKYPSRRSGLVEFMTNNEKLKFNNLTWQQIDNAFRQNYRGLFVLKYDSLSDFKIKNKFILERYKTLKEAKRAIKKLKIHTIPEYQKNRILDLKLPPCPQKEYRNEWEGWSNFLGSFKGIYSRGFTFYKKYKKTPFRACIRTKNKKTLCLGGYSSKINAFLIHKIATILFFKYKIDNINILKEKANKILKHHFKLILKICQNDIKMNNLMQKIDWLNNL